jgi:hypothetical protein
MIPLYALVNDVLSLCMIMDIFALLVGRSQSFASLHFVLRGNTSRASNSQKPSLFQYVHHTYLLAIAIPSTFDLLFSILQIKFFVLCEN